jgi:hypothetical protein
VFVGAKGYLPTDYFSPSPDDRNGFVPERGQNMIAVTCITVGKYVLVERLPYDMESNKCSSPQF